jgi:hypothetical protein
MAAAAARCHPGHPCLTASRSRARLAPLAAAANTTITVVHNPPEARLQVASPLPAPALDPHPHSSPRLQPPSTRGPTRRSWARARGQPGAAPPPSSTGTTTRRRPATCWRAALPSPPQVAPAPAWPSRHAPAPAAALPSQRLAAAAPRRPGCCPPRRRRRPLCCCCCRCRRRAGGGRQGRPGHLPGRHGMRVSLLRCGRSPAQPGLQPPPGPPFPPSLPFYRALPMAGGRPVLLRPLLARALAADSMPCAGTGTPAPAAACRRVLPQRGAAPT